MTITLQFVSDISTSPTVRLDLKASPFNLADVVDFSLPELKYNPVDTMADDGEVISASSYSNRTVTLALSISPLATSAQAGDAITTLIRELQRPNNILKVQIGAVPLFLRTYRASPREISMIKLMPKNSKTTIAIQCEPFAYGLKTSLGTYTFSENPASGSYPMYVDVTPARGEVDSPLYIKGTNLYGYSSLTAVRRHGTPGNMPWYIQGESMTAYSTSTPLASTNASGGSGMSIAVNSSVSTLKAGFYLPTTSPTSAQAAELRGRYRLFAAVRMPDVSTDPVDGGDSGIRVYAKIAGRYTNPVTLYRRNNDLQMLDLGSISVPVGEGGERAGYANAPGVGPVKVELYAYNSGVSMGMYVDWVTWWPEDEDICEVAWPASPSGTYQVFDGPNDDAYTIDSNGLILSALDEDFPKRTGRIPHILPGTTNRVFFIRRLRNLKVDGTLPSALGAASITLEYWPRYLSLFPNDGATPPVGAFGFGLGSFGSMPFGGS